MSRVRAVLLDMGGVLLDFGNAQGLPAGRVDWRGREALLALLRDGRGSKLTQEDLDRLLFAPWRRDYARRYETGREADWHPHLVHLRRAAHRRFSDRRLLATWFAPFAQTVTPLPGALEALESLRRQGLRLALVSNVPLPGEHYRPLLSHHRLDLPFERLFFSYDEGTRKPSPGLLSRALAALDCPPGEAVMVGDRKSIDIAAGRAVGVRTVWLRSPDAEGPVPDHTIGALLELPDLLARLP